MMAQGVVYRRDGHAQLADEGGKGWSSGTCACCSEIDSLCLACWCPCIQFGHNVERAFISQRGRCCRWAGLWLSSFIAAYMFLVFVRGATGHRECEIVCHTAGNGLKEVGELSGANLTNIDVNSDCFERHCQYVFPVAVEVLEPFVWIVAALVTAFLAARRRELLRAQHQIRGSLHADVLCHCLCGCCSLAQEARQIAYEELQSRQGEQNGVPSRHAPGFIAPAALPPAYAQPAYAQPAHAGYTAETPTVLAQPVYLATEARD
ncbi:hypothetical protein T492DRAFT_1052852 [Pavlovales sp. CCMP2436]|nr:hypothetical protein T492DRAFT_1052852 [Pavlovales sp. CCMP2436]